MMSLDEPDIGPLIDDEFLINVVGIGLRKVFLTEFENFLGQFPPREPARQKMGNKNKANLGARV